jgi:DNA-binding MarR family transcriptional regulator
MTDSVDKDLARGLVGHPTADPVTEAVIARIVQIARQHERVMREAATRHGMSLADCEVIFYLAHHGDRDAQHTPGQLAKAFQITAGSMTSRLDRLERAGYIERRIDPGNRVNIQVTLTPAGHTLHHGTVADIIELRRTLITDALPAKQLATLNSLLRRVLTHIEHRDSPHPAAPLIEDRE